MTQRNETSDADGKSAGRYHHGDLRAALVAEARRVVETAGPEAPPSGGGQPPACHRPRPIITSRTSGTSCRRRGGGLQGVRPGDGAARGEAEDGGSDPAGGFQGLGVGYVTFAVKHPALYALMHGPAFQGEGHPAVGGPPGERRPLDRGGRRACLPDATEDEKMAACAAAWSLVHGMATLCLDGRLGWMLDLEDLDAAAHAITRQLDITRAIGSSARAAEVWEEP